MKMLYFDCKNGISGDMLLNALKSLSGCAGQVEQAMAAEDFTAAAHEQASHHNQAHDCDHDHHHDDMHTHDNDQGCHFHGRSYAAVQELIRHSSFSVKAKETALHIYRHIAEAEAEVHGATLETVHFHEVGRDEAIRNALGIGMALEIIDPDRICVSDIYDGKGTVVCSHGEIPVPVPAVQALMQRCSYVFKTADDVHTELVTPSGLAGLMGIGAEPSESAGRIILETEAYGRRDTGRGGLKACLAENPTEEDMA